MPTPPHAKLRPVSRSANSSERTAAASRQQQQRGDSRLGSNAAQRQLVLLGLTVPIMTFRSERPATRT